MAPGMLISKDQLYPTSSGLYFNDTSWAKAHYIIFVADADKERYRALVLGYRTCIRPARLARAEV